MNLWSRVETCSGLGPRAAHTCTAIKGRLVIFGGWNGSSAMNDLTVYNPSTDRWLLVPRLPNCPEARNNHAAALVGSKLVVFGGHSGSHWLGDLHILDLAPDALDVLESSAIVSGFDAPTVAPDSYGMAGGLAEMEFQGSVLNSEHPNRNGAVVYETTQEIACEVLSWSQPEILGIPPAARACHSLTAVGNKLYLFGGFDGSKCFSEMEVLDLETLSWIQPRVSGIIPLARNAHSMVASGKKLVMFGGHSGNRHLTDLHVFDTSRLEWSQPTMSGSLPVGLRGHSASLVDGRVIVFGGFDGKRRTNDIRSMRLSDYKWSKFDVSGRVSIAKQSSRIEGDLGSSPTPSESPVQEHDYDDGSGGQADIGLFPCGRQRHTECVVGNSIYIIGGFDGERWLNDMYGLNYRKLSSSSAPAEARKTLKNYEQLLTDGLFADIEFIFADGSRVKAHRAILAAQCSHFKHVFSSGMQECHTKEFRIADEWAQPVFMLFLRYIYTGQILDDADRGELLDLLSLADHYSLESLRDDCQELLCQRVSIETACAVLMRADRSGGLKLKKFAIDFILSNFDAVVQSPEYESLSSKPGLLIEISRSLASLSKS